MPEKNTPKPSSAQAAYRMRRVRQRNTQPEILLRKELHRLGLRYRLNATPVCGIRTRADIVFAKAKVAVFVNGCFWHSCPVHRTAPKQNADWWAEKIKRNVERDGRIDCDLRTQGWISIRIWEHEDPKQAAQRVYQEVVNSGCRMDLERR